ncbi:MAG: ATP-binding cassette domain-containing protein [Planctomycetes bacterium]|nr:ATP-binding cassette domain-containing protein [Planctomycetota bacterium]
MITVQNLSKTYGLTQALKGITFEVHRGEVIGFLGPNGAGKSTTMKILTGYLLPSGGKATVDGLDVVEDSLEVRRKIGYLPESTPLYTEMRVDDYLRFAAEIRGVPAREVAPAVDRVVSLCGLQRAVGKNILELSKGYKQRVGLAQAMVHQPDVLILDEPTSGLDPNQIVEVRGLIKRLSEDHTVILSTHYLQEVEASCSRVIIVRQGEIVANDTRDRLVAQMPGGAIVARIKGPAEAVQRQLREVFQNRPVRELANEAGYVTVRIDPGTSHDSHLAEAVAKLVVKNGWDLAELYREKATLEDVFRAKTTESGKEVSHA